MQKKDVNIFIQMMNLTAMNANLVISNIQKVNAFLAKMKYLIVIHAIMI